MRLLHNKFKLDKSGDGQLWSQIQTFAVDYHRVLLTRLPYNNTVPFEDIIIEIINEPSK